MQSQRNQIALGVLAVFMAVGLLLGPAGFGRGDQRAEASQRTELKKLFPSDLQAGDAFGSVAVSGDTVVVGAHDQDKGGTWAGAVYIFERNEGGADNWGEVKKLLASNAQAFADFGRSVAISVDTVVVGASFEDAESSNSGAAYVFGRDEGGAGNWGEVKKLTASDGQAFANFGRSVAISGDSVVVGAHAGDTGGTRLGAAYIFERNQGGADNWGEVQKFTASDVEIADLFGSSVAISGDSAVVGAVLEDAGGTLHDNFGAAYVFERDLGGADNWGQVTKLTASNPAVGAFFGVRVSLSADIIVVGATGQDVEDINAGSVYVFGRDQGGADNWGEVAQLTASDAQAGDQFGLGLVVSGDTTVVGAYLEDAGGGTRDDFGAAYVFRQDQGGPDNWGELTKYSASDAQAGDQFGRSVALNGDTAIVGALSGDTAYVFDLLQPKPTPCPAGKVAVGGGCGTPTPCPTAKVALAIGCGTPTPTPKQPDGDGDGDTIPNSSDLDDDNDGCTDLAELQTALGSEVTGGLRNPHIYWDFMDMWVNKEKDGRVNIIDVGATVKRFGRVGDRNGDPLDPPQDLTSYHVSADRSPPVGDNVWNLGPADGQISIIEMGAAVLQFGHDCSGSP